MRQCGHCSAEIRGKAVKTDNGEFCDDRCEFLFENAGVRMTCPVCDTAFGSRQGFGLFCTEECAINFAPIAAKEQINFFLALR